MQISSPELFKIERDQLIKIIRRWGGLTTDALLDPDCQFFSIPHIEGVIGYRIESNCIVVCGDPICSPNDLSSLVEAFHSHYQEKMQNIIYLTVSDKFAKWALNKVCKASIKFGEELSIDPYDPPMNRQGTHASLVRRKVKHALKEGTTVEEYISQNSQLEQDLEQVSRLWLKGRQGPQIHISQVHLFQNRFGKRWFYAKKDEKFVGLVVLNQLESKQGWLLNHLMITPDASNGTPELLVVSTLETLKREECHFVTFGAVPSNELNEIIGLGQFSSWIIRQIFKMTSKMFHLNGHKMFWGKFHPKEDPCYLLFTQPRLGMKETRALMRVMNVSF